MTTPGFYTLTPDGARITLRVTPNARADSLDGPEIRADGASVLRLRVSAPPDKGAANSAVIALLARALGRPKSSLTLLSGQTARIKVILAAGDPKDLAETLDGLAGG